MTLRTLPLQWNIPNANVGSVSLLNDAVFKQQLGAFKNTSLWGVMTYAVQSLHDYRDREMSQALSHVQSMLKLPSPADVTLSLQTVKQLALQVQSGKNITAALDVLEGFGAVGLHKNNVFAPAMRELVTALAKATHADDLHFVMEVAAEVPGARAPMDAIARSVERELTRVLSEAENPRHAAQSGDSDRLMQLVQKNRDIDYRTMIHDAALWGEWLAMDDKSGNGHPLTGVAIAAHQEMFPGYVYPHGKSNNPVDMMFNDGFVRGRR
jgi:hypothetical protein